MQCATWPSDVLRGGVTSLAPMEEYATARYLFKSKTALKGRFCNDEVGQFT